MKRALIISLAAIVTGCSGGGGGVFSPLSPGASGGAGVSVATAAPTAIPTPVPTAAPTAAPSATPMPTPSPSPTATPVPIGAFVVTPTTISLGGPDPTTTTISVTETGYAGGFTETDNCLTPYTQNGESFTYQVATIASKDATTWLVTQNPLAGPAIPNHVNSLISACTVTISDKIGHHTDVVVLSHLLGIQIFSKGRNAK